VYGSDEAQESYNKLVAEWLARGRKLPNHPKRKPRRATIAEVSDTGVEVLTVGQLVGQYQEWAERRYTNSNQAEIIFYALRPMTECYGSLPACEFSPNKLRAVRSLMVERQWTRSNLNRAISLVRGAFGWGVSHELIPESIHAALRLVEPIPYGAEGVKESQPKELVSDEMIEAIRPYLSRQVYSLLRLAMLSGARMGELVQLKPGLLNPVEVDGVRILEFSPPVFKTKYRGLARVVRFGPRSAMIINPFLNRGDDEFLFSPREAESERRKKMHKLRVTPLSYGNRPGTNRKENPQWKPGNCYSTCSVRKSIRRAVNTYNRHNPDNQIEMFTPHRLRHSALTRMRNEYGFEAAMAAAGHSSPSMTQLYTEKSSKAGRRLAAAAG